MRIVVVAISLVRFQQSVLNLCRHAAGGREPTYVEYVEVKHAQAEDVAEEANRLLYLEPPLWHEAIDIGAHEEELRLGVQVLLCHIHG